MGELLDQLCRATGIFTVELTGSAAGGFADKCLPTAGAGHGQLEGVAHGPVFGDLGNDLIGQVDSYRVTDTKLEFIEDVG